jgi:hypothetical protein
MTTVAPSYLAPIYQEVAQVAGLDAALKLSAAYGGTRIYLPSAARLTRVHWLAVCVGWEAAQAICAWRGREDIVLPIPAQASPSWRRKIAFDMLASGASVNEVAAASGVHLRTIYEYRRRGFALQQQLDLFEENTSSSRPKRAR